MRGRQCSATAGKRKVVNGGDQRLINAGDLARGAEVSKLSNIMKFSNQNCPTKSA